MNNPIPNNKPFKKGQSGNPAGRPPKLIKHTIKELQAEGVEEATPTDIKACYLTLINMSIPALEAKVKDTEQSALVRIVGKAILSGKGFDIIERMLDRSIGRAQQSIDHTTKGQPITEIRRTIIDPKNEHPDTEMGSTAT
jgi:hypothetical protein